MIPISAKDLCEEDDFGNTRLNKAVIVEKANWRKVLLSGLSEVSSLEGFSGDDTVH